MTERFGTGARSRLLGAAPTAAVLAGMLAMMAPAVARAQGECPSGQNWGSALNANGQCETDFSYTGAPQTFTVPAGVSSLSLVVDGAQGGGSGGAGGQESGMLAVTPNETLTLVVGGEGANPPVLGNLCTVYPGGQGGYGGGGAGGGGSESCGNTPGSGGGGGSFVFGPDGSLLLAAGGGGGGGGATGPPFGYVGGQGGNGGGTGGGTAGDAAGDVNGDVWGPGQGGGGASASGAGPGASPWSGYPFGPSLDGFGSDFPCSVNGTSGTAGSGPASSPSAFGIGGEGGTADAGSDCNGYAGLGDGGGGGGGGYYGGGGGGGDLPAAGGGGGGSGYAAQSVTGAGSQVGGSSYINGEVAITFAPLSQLQITTTSLPNGVLGNPYPTATGATVFLHASGGSTPYTWSIVPGSGSLPDGLSLNSSSGAITGTPTKSGTFNFTVQVQDSSNPELTNTTKLSIEIDKLAVTSVTTCHVTSPTASCGSGRQDGASGCASCAEGGYNGGVPVTVNGVGFTLGGTCAPTVSFVLGDGTPLPATIQGTPSDTQLQVRSPAIKPSQLSNGEAFSDVVVTCGQDSSAQNPSTDQFAYVPPTVTSVTPGQGSFTQGTPVYVHGIGLAGARVITLDPTAANPNIPAQILSSSSSGADQVTVSSTGDDTVTFTAPSFNSFAVGDVTQSVFFDLRAGVPYSQAPGQSAQSAVNNPADVFEYKVGGFQVTVQGDNGAGQLHDSQHLFSNDTLKVSGSGFDPNGGPITLQVDDQPSLSAPAGTNLKAELPLGGWRSRDAQGCHATLTVSQAEQSMQIPLHGQPVAFLAFLAGSMSAPISHQPVATGDPICQGESTVTDTNSVLGPFKASGLKAFILDTAASVDTLPGNEVQGPGGPAFQPFRLGGTAITNMIYAPDNGISVGGLVPITAGGRLCVQYEQGQYVILTSNGADHAVDLGTLPQGPGENASAGQGICPPVRNQAPLLSPGDLDATAFNPAQTNGAYDPVAFLDESHTFFYAPTAFSHSIYALSGLVIGRDSVVYTAGSALVTAGLDSNQGGALVAARDITVTGTTTGHGAPFALFANGDTDLLGAAVGIAGSARPQVVTYSSYDSANGANFGVQTGPPPYWQLNVPPGALPVDTQIGIYTTPEFSGLQQMLPPGQGYLEGLTILWAGPDGTNPPATKPVTLTVTDASIHAGDTVYIWTPTGIQQANATVSNGQAVITFTSDPTFIIAQPSSSAGGSGGSGGGAGGVILSASPTIDQSCHGTVTSSHTASLAAEVNPNGLATSAYFEYGTSASYGEQTDMQQVGSGFQDDHVDATLAGLTADTTYHCRVVAASSAGTAYGPDQTFQTPAVGGLPPSTEAQLASPHLQLGALARHATRCTLGLLGARAAAARGRTCTVTVTLTGTIDRRADGEPVTLALHPLDGGPPISRHALVDGGRFTLAVRLSMPAAPGAKRSWTFKIAYAGDHKLLPARATGGFTLMVRPRAARRRTRRRHT